MLFLLLTGALLLQSPSAPSRPLTPPPDSTPADTARITEWLVPWENTRPRDPFVAPDGRVWFCGQAGGYVAVFDPTDESFRRYDLGEGAGPHNLIVDRDGFVWYAGNLRGHIGRLDPETGAIEKFAMPDPAVRDPHTLVFDARGDIWFTAQFSNYIGHLDTSSGEIRLVEVPTGAARPYGIVLDSNGRPWIALFGTNMLATVDPTTFRLREIALPRSEARPRRLQITGDNAVWYVDYAGGFVGRFDPTSGRTEEWQLPAGGRARPYGMAVDRFDRLWFVDGGARPNQFIGFDTVSRAFLGSASVPSGGGTVRHMYYDAETNSVWFGTDTNNLGKALLPGRNDTPKTDI
jgi:virginiamycin B lyase